MHDQSQERQRSEQECGSWHELFPLPLTGAAHTLPSTASAARNVPKFLDETTPNATKMHAQTDPAATAKATRLLCRRILVNYLRPAAAADCFQCLGLVAAYTRSLLPDCENNSKVLDARLTDTGTNRSGLFLEETCRHCQLLVRRAVAEIRACIEAVA